MKGVTSIIGSNISVLLLLLYCISHFTVSFEISGRIIYILFALWFLSVLFNEETRRLMMSSRYVFLWGFVVSTFLLSVVFKGIISSLRESYIVLSVVSPIIMYDQCKTFSKKQNKFILYSMLLVLVMDSFEALTLTKLTDAQGLRALEHYFGIETFNLFSLVYGFCIIAGSIAFCLLNSNKLSFKKTPLLFISLIVVFLLFSVVVFKSFFITSLMVLFISIIIAFFYYKKRPVLKIMITLFAFAIIYVSSFSLILSRVGSANMDLSILQNKMVEIENVLTNNKAAASDVNERQDFSQSSFETFLKHPLVGVFTETNSFDDTITAGIGNHGEWFDLMGKYGLLVLLLYTFMIKSYKIIADDSSSFFPIIPYVIIGFLNPVFAFIQNLSALFIAPLIIKYNIKQENQD